MDEHRCRYCDYYLFSATPSECKVRIICKRCKRAQVVDLSTKGPPPRTPSHLAVAGLG